MVFGSMRAWAISLRASRAGTAALLFVASCGGADKASPDGADAADANVANDSSGESAVSRDAAEEPNQRDADVADEVSPADADACPDAPLWTSTSLTFTLVLESGWPYPPMPDVGCQYPEATYQFSVPDQTLSERGCLATGAVDRLARLTSNEVAAIVTNVGAMRTTCTKLCGDDAPSVNVTVEEPGVWTTYTSNFYVGCPGSGTNPPFVTLESLLMLETLLGQIMSGACATDAGVDAGRCAAAP
jgi:hypothetical protein